MGCNIEDSSLIDKEKKHDYQVRKLIQSISVNDCLNISVLSGQDAGNTYYIKIKTLLIGRLDTCDIKLSDEDISDRHATLFAQNGNLLIQDYDSTNGTYLNGERVYEAMPLAEGDRIKIGRRCVLELSMRVAVESNYRPFLDDAISRDRLTKAYNKQYFTAHLYGLYHHAKTASESLGLILVNIDNYGKIKINNGNDAGEKVLIYVAELLHEIVRTVDVMACCGDDNFAILCPGKTLRQTMTFSQHILKLIESCNFVYEYNNIDLTASIGITSYPELNSETLHDFLLSTDLALSMAKSNGGNCVVIAEQ